MTRPSPLQNRVTPTGDIIADRGRGLLTGNRGCLADSPNQLGRLRWRSKLWISCVLDWRGRRLEVMPCGRWTALFFLDEATALAAGHRPCGYCRRADYLAYAHAWQAAQGLSTRPKAWQMDAQLHAERVRTLPRRQVTRPARVADLPDGVIVRHEGTVGLLRDGTVRPWSSWGYGEAEAVPSDAAVELLTPPASVGALACGYRPLLHPSVTAPLVAAS